MNPRTRIAPSPTGEYHIGHIRTVLYNYAWAKKNKGRFILRIEDTDRERFIPGAAEKIMKVIKDYRLSWDEGPDIGGPCGPYVQSQRLDFYQKHIKLLLNKGKAYYCFCSPERLAKLRAEQKAKKIAPKYDRLCLKLSDQEVKKKLKAKIPHTIRLKVPHGEIIKFNDLVRGEVKVRGSDVDDQILIKSDGIPTYHFAVVVDDHLMKISHVLRGEEWLSSMPKQVLLYRYFGWKMPVFCHLTVLLDPKEKGKMSKRRGSVSAQSFLKAGYLPEAVLNFLMLLGWNPGTEKEFFTLEEFIKAFDLKKLHKKPPVFDREKLDYFNGHYLRQKSDQDLARLLEDFLPKLGKKDLLLAARLVKERIENLSQAEELLEFVWQEVEYDPDLFLSEKVAKDQVLVMLEKAREAINSIGIEKTNQLQAKFLALIKEKGWRTGDFFMVFRIAIAGKKITPPILESLLFLDRKKALARIDSALKKLKS